MTNRVILPKEPPKPIAEFSLNVNEIEEMLNNAKSGGAVEIVVYPAYAEVVLR